MAVVHIPDATHARLKAHCADEGLIAKRWLSRMVVGAIDAELETAAGAPPFWETGERPERKPAPRPMVTTEPRRCVQAPPKVEPPPPAAKLEPPTAPEPEPDRPRWYHPSESPRTKHGPEPFDGSCPPDCEICRWQAERGITGTRV